MAITFKLIESQTIGAGGAASITFGSGGTIPQTYTDLKILFSGRNTTANGVVYFSFNGTTSGRSFRGYYGNGQTMTAGSFSGDDFDPRIGLTNQSDYTANTFSNSEIYIPNYTASIGKSWTADSVQDQNVSLKYCYILSGIWNVSSAITSITLTPISGNFAQYSTFYLYGIKNS